MSNSHSLTESETFFIQLFVTKLWTWYFWILAHQPLDKLNLKINKYFTKKPILHLCTFSMTAENILVAQGVNYPAFVDKMLPSQHHHPLSLRKNGTSDPQLRTRAANEAVWSFENTFASMVFLKNHTGASWQYFHKEAPRMAIEVCIFTESQQYLSRWCSISLSASESPLLRDQKGHYVTGHRWEISRTMNIMNHTKAEMCPPKAFTELASAQ